MRVNSNYQEGLYPKQSLHSAVPLLVSAAFPSDVVSGHPAHSAARQLKQQRPNKETMNLTTLKFSQMYTLLYVQSKVSWEMTCE